MDGCVGIEKRVSAWKDGVFGGGIFEIYKNMKGLDYKKIPFQPLSASRPYH